MKKAVTNTVLIAILLMVGLLTACGAKDSKGAASDSSKPADNAGASAAAPAHKKLRIGVSYQGLQNEFILNIQDALRARAAEAGVELIEVDGQGKAENQISQIENFITQKVDVIIFNPFDKDACAPAVDKAVAANIPIVVVNAETSNLDKATAYVGSNNEESGRIEMQYMADKLGGKGNIAIIEGPQGHSAMTGRNNGIKEILAKYPDIKIVLQQTANWDRTQALSLMENWLQSGKKIDAVVAHNDEMALGAYKAIEAAKKEKEIMVIGIDAIPDALKAVEEGKMVATVFQDARGQGAGAVDVAIKIAKGEKVEHTSYIPYQLVTKDNLADFKK